jgi:hypothetical protein
VSGFEPVPVSGRFASPKRESEMMREIVYDVFARKDRGDQLVHIGYIDALDDETARVYAWKTYDEEKWFEMCVVERTAIIPVNRDEGVFVNARRADA